MTERGRETRREQRGRGKEEKDEPNLDQNAILDSCSFMSHEQIFGGRED